MVFRRGKRDDKSGASVHGAFGSGTATADAQLKGAAAEKVAADQFANIKRAQEQALADEAAESALRSKYARYIMLAAVGQIAVVDVGFWFYGYANRWHISTASISAWIGGTVAEIVSLAVIVVRYLFQPRRPLALPVSASSSGE